MRETSSRRASAGGKTRRRPRSSGGGGPLTTREREILRLLASGMGTAAIARHLSLSTATVRNHAQRIIGKLDVHSRLAAVARGYALGLLPVPARSTGSWPQPGPPGL
jgi:DNA-binding NarL/FixJ family response regulator